MIYKLTHKDLAEEYKNVQYHDIDIYMFPFLYDLIIHLGDVIIYKHITNNPDIPYLNKILKLGDEKCEIFRNIYNDDEFDYAYEINYISDNYDKKTGDILLNILFNSI